MTGVLEGTADTGRVGRPRRDRDEPRLVDEALADELIEQARQQGVELLGEGGLLKQMTKAILKWSLQVELTDHLGYEESDPAGAGSGNSRNGTTRKRLATEAGQVDLQVPRDRNATFSPQTDRKGQRRLDGVDKLVRDGTPGIRLVEDEELPVAVGMPAVAVVLGIRRGRPDLIGLVHTADTRKVPVSRTGVRRRQRPARDRPAAVDGARSATVVNGRLRPPLPGRATSACVLSRT